MRLAERPYARVCVVNYRDTLPNGLAATRFTAWRRSLPIKTSRTTSILFPTTVDYVLREHASSREVRQNKQLHVTSSYFSFYKTCPLPVASGLESSARVAGRTVRRGLYMAVGRVLSQKPCPVSTG